MVAIQQVGGLGGPDELRGGKLKLQGGSSLVRLAFSEQSWVFPAIRARHSCQTGQRLTQTSFSSCRWTKRPVLSVVRGELSRQLEKEGAVTRATPGVGRTPGAQVTVRFRCEGGRESAVIGHGHDGAGGSLNRACHGTGKLAELDTARTASGGDVRWSFGEKYRARSIDT